MHAFLPSFFPSVLLSFLQGIRTVPVLKLAPKRSSHNVWFPPCYGVFLLGLPTTTDKLMNKQHKNKTPAANSIVCAGSSCRMHVIQQVTLLYCVCRQQLLHACHTAGHFTLLCVQAAVVACVSYSRSFYSGVHVWCQPGSGTYMRARAMCDSRVACFIPVTEVVTASRV